MRKYRSQRMTCPETGEKFDSKSEYKRWRELKLLEMAGEIRNLRRQVRYPLEIDGRPIKTRSKGVPNGRRCFWTADFVYEERDSLMGIGWNSVIEDRKGFDTQTSRFRRAVFEAMHDVRVRIT